MNQQRQIIYGVRKQILEASAHKNGATLKDEILQKIENEIINIVTVYSVDIVDHPKIVDEFSSVIPFDENSKKGLLEEIKKFGAAEQIIEFLTKLALDLYETREKQIGGDV